MLESDSVILFTSGVISESFWLLNGFDNACSSESIDSKLWMRFDVITCRDYPLCLHFLQDGQSHVNLDVFWFIPLT